MNKLQKNTWLGLGIVVIGAFISTGLVTSVIAFDTQGLIYLIALGIACFIIIVFGTYFTYKDEREYDEREKMISQRASRWAAYVLIFFLTLACNVPFILIGWRGNVPTYYLLIIFWGSLLITTVVYSSVILFQCAKERGDG